MKGTYEYNTQVHPEVVDVEDLGVCEGQNRDSPELGECDTR